MPDSLESLGFTPAANAQDPNDFTNLYNTPIPPDQQASYDAWAEQQKAKTGRDPRDDRYDYDIQGDYLAGAARDERGHGTDQFKKPNHTTFSNQSQYQGQHGYQGGYWTDPQPSGERGMFHPSATNLQFTSPADLQAYFDKEEPETRLVLPQQALAQSNPLDYKNAGSGGILDGVGFVPVISQPEGPTQ